jgi:beta-glucosidase
VTRSRYKYYTSEFGAPLYEFGHGLSLTPFTLKWATGSTSSPAVVSLHTTVEISVDVRNAGAREGDTVVMLYHCPSRDAIRVRADMPVPNRRLVGYRRVGLAAGANTVVTFNVTAEELALVDGNGDTQLFVGRHQLRVWHGTAPIEQALQREFDVKQRAMLRTLQW